MSYVCGRRQNPQGFAYTFFLEVIMEKPFEDKRDKPFIVLEGLVVIEGRDDFFCGLFEPWRMKGAAIERIENHVTIEGYQAGIDVKVFEHLHLIREMKELTPYHNRNGIKKFAAQNDVYVVLADQTSKRQVYVIAHRSFPNTAVDWEAGPCRDIPVAIGKQPDKPLSQPLDLSKVTKPEDGDGQSSKDLDEKTKQDLAGEELDHGTSKNGGHVDPPKVRKAGKNKAQEKEASIN